MVQLEDLRQASLVAVHFASPVAVGSNLIGQLGFHLSDVSIGHVRTDEDLLAVIAHALRFPDYFGNNWDALDECLVDLDWLPASGYLLLLRDASAAWFQAPSTLGKLVTAWLEAANSWNAADKPFHLVFVI